MIEFFGSVAILYSIFSIVVMILIPIFIVFVISYLGSIKKDVETMREFFCNNVKQLTEDEKLLEKYKVDK